MSDLADGQEHQLDPRAIGLHRVTGSIPLAIIAVWSFATRT